MAYYNWNNVEREQLSPLVGRQMIHGERITAARIFLDQGAAVPRHQHENEQITLLQSGRLKFVFDDETITLEAGEVMQIAPNRAHRVEALEDSMALDVFAPIRSDWITGDDAYLRQR
jgi:quercetin dioxygenase-like cupin family protein